MKIVASSFLILIVLSMTTSSALLANPQEPIPQAFAQSTLDSIQDLGNYVVFVILLVTSRDTKITHPIPTITPIITNA